MFSDLFPPSTPANPWGNAVRRASVPQRAKQTCTSALCAVTMPLATTMVSGPVRDAKPSLKEVSKVTSPQRRLVVDWSRYLDIPIFTCMHILLQ